MCYKVKQTDDFYIFLAITFKHYKKMLLRPRFKNAAIGPKNAA